MEYRGKYIYLRGCVMQLHCAIKHFYIDFLWPRASNAMQGIHGITREKK